MGKILVGESNVERTKNHFTIYFQNFYIYFFSDISTKQCIENSQADMGILRTQHRNFHNIY